MTSLEVDSAAARADLARHVAEGRAVEAVVKESNGKVVAKVKGLEKTVAT